MGVAKLGALVLLGVSLAGVMGPGCSNRAEDPALNGEGVRGSVPVGEMTGGGGGGGTPLGSGGGTSMGGDGSTSVSGGGGTSVSCLENPGCQPQDAVCGAGRCTDGKCVFTVRPLASDVYGDCHKTVCDTQGKVILVVDDTAPNVYDDGNLCTTDMCMNGETINQVNLKAMCTLNSGAKGICSPNGSCVECLSETECKNGQFPQCKLGGCVASHCVNGLYDNDGKETGVDCGGPDCAPCSDVGVCNQNDDCQSLVCSDAGGFNLCSAPQCTDSVKNGKETDVDCGAVCQPVGRLCSDGKRCALPTDCQSGVCKAGTCQAPSCTDGVKNAAENGIDCGGTCGPVPCLPPL